MLEPFWGNSSIHCVVTRKESLELLLIVASSLPGDWLALKSDDHLWAMRHAFPFESRSSLECRGALYSR